MLQFVIALLVLLLPREAEAQANVSWPWSESRASGAQPSPQPDPTRTEGPPEKRIALLIGNKGYDSSVGALKNPFNDIELVGQVLRRQGFDVLPEMKDAKRTAILGGVRELVRQLNAAGPGSIGIIYYSGHGAAEKDTNINYLIPVDATEPGTSAFWDESVKLDDILKLLDGARHAARFVVFDACRNELRLPSKDATKGLVPVVEQQGIFIAYASAPGHTASDRGERSGPYAEALAAELGKPGLDHLNLFQNVKELVLATTNGFQQPWESNGLARRVYLTGRPVADPAALKRVEAERAWERVKDSRSPAVLEWFITQFPETVFAALARERFNELQVEARASAIVREQERQGLAMLEMQEQERNRAELERAAQNQIKAAKEAAARREVEDRTEARNGPRARNIERGPSPRATSHSPDPLTGATKIMTGIQG